MWDRTPDPVGVTGLSRNVVLRQAVRVSHMGGTDKDFRHVVDLCQRELARPDDGDWIRRLYLRLCRQWHERLLTGVGTPVLPAGAFASTAEAILAEDGHPLAGPVYPSWP